MLRTRKGEFVDGKGQAIVLKGFNLGNWQLIEPNMLGTAGVQRKLRSALEQCAGKEKADLFFKGLLDKWVTEADIRYLKSLGCNSLRLPLNYRYFEKDQEPFTYLEEGFDLIDRVLNWCKRYEIYLILDMHAAQGFQSGDWNCENLFEEQTGFYKDRGCQKRFLALWAELATRYRDEEWIGGYDLLNEPVTQSTEELDALNRIYREAVKKIREADPGHLIILEGDQWAIEFDGLEAPFEQNLAYSCHYYCDGAVQDCAYPGNYEGKHYGKGEMKKEISYRNAYMLRHEVPCWVGEFGVRRLGRAADKEEAFKDYLTVFAEQGLSWCYWNFKDLKVRGPLYLDEESAWCKFQKEFQVLKERYHTDRSLPIKDAWDLESVFADFREGDLPLGLVGTKELLIRNMRETLANQLTCKFAEMIGERTEREIETLTDSFLFENCKIDKGWESILREYLL